MTTVLDASRRGRYGVRRAAAAQRDTLRTVRIAAIGAVSIAALLQLVFFSGAERNVFCTLIATVSSLLGLATALNSNRFRSQPVSALILLFYAITATAGALIVKTLEWTPLTGRLQMPLGTFGMLLGAQIVLLIADWFYRHSRLLNAMRRTVTQRVLVPIGLLRWPSDTQFWVLGGLGCVSVLLTGTDYESGASFGLASAGAKLLRAFGFLKFAPFLIPFRSALSGVSSRPHLPMLALGGYFVALIGISFATNSRSTFADAVPTIAICLLVATALGRFELARVPRARLVWLMVAAIVGSVLLSRVALAMVVVRDYRNSVDVGMLVRMTFEALTNDEWLEAAKAKMDTAVYIANYSEDYVDSRFFGRFLLTKFHDNMLYYFSLLGDDALGVYKTFMVDRIAATLPDPLLRLFGFSIDKQDLVVSNGDYVVYLVDGWGLGGFKTGSMIAEALVVFRWGSPLVLVICAWLLFVFHDAFTARTEENRLVVSPMIILLIWNLCGTTAAFGLGAETVTAIPAGIVRGLPQNIVFYLLAVTITGAVLRFAGSRR